MQHRAARPGAASGTGPPQPAAGAEIPDPVGSESAKPRITVVLGHCFAPVMRHFVPCGEAWPDLVRGFFAFESQEGQRIVAEQGETLACIIINGENRFTIPDGEGEREVHFYGPPGRNCKLADVVAVL